ncbi:double-strand break repair protein AddB [Sphingomonas sp. AP4-R1]|uniref:double-strand break repair protein AddB n=1 Tax=Sphingomonas sp. AP4-R1 TaxID=2735134 RepID=UPI001493808C|nr:double-strand break repair protein AddB [Sphingomonas sp. AP4-R1]QJU58691.1 double-strand break repair protein AddB [Sphingomonas sp. AP4-R1]
MSDTVHPRIYTIPPHRAFADALAAGLLARFGKEPLGLARGVVLLPNNRARRAIRDAFVRASGGALLLPRLVSIGDPALDEAIGAALETVEAPFIPPAIDPVARQLILARLIEAARASAGEEVDAGEAMRFAADLGRTLDQLIVEGIDPGALREAVPDELAAHWQASLTALSVVLDRWPEELKRRGRIDLADRRNRLIAATAARWRVTPPEGFVVAAGVSAAGPAVGDLLRTISRMEKGLVVLAGLDRAMPDAEWEALRGAEGVDGIETHPQFGLSRLLDRIGVAREEVRLWRPAGAEGARSVRTVAIGHAMTPAAFTDKWQILKPHQRRLSNVRSVELAHPAAEAQAIALALREALEVPGRTAALVTPDRALAVRVVQHLKRWGIDADDSAGRPLALMAPGTLLLAIAEAVAADFAPVPLLALLKHPLVMATDRAPWLEGVRALDRALRGPRPGPGLEGITRFLSPTGNSQEPFGLSLSKPRPSSDDGQGEGQPFDKLRANGSRDWAEREKAEAFEAWKRIEPLLAPFSRPARPTLAGLMALVREAATALAEDAAWSRPAGRAAADLVAGLEEGAHEGPQKIEVATFPALLRAALEQVAVRPPQGGHPRLFIWGLIDARLQRADLMVLGGLNEGVWPSLPSPDPWLAPAIRRALGLPGLERRIGAEAEEFAAALGAPEVLLTRSRRDARAPAIASRFWLRLDAMTGRLPRAHALARWGDALDKPALYAPAEQPAPVPPVADRPRRIAVTKLDRLKADPFAFYADAMLKLRAMDAVDADPTPAWRGNAVHAILEEWLKQDQCDPALLRARAEKLLAEAAAHPVLRALWSPRLMEAIDWIAETTGDDLVAGRVPVRAEIKGRIDVQGITLEGTADRIDRDREGHLAIVDYKTGKPPSKKAVIEGYSMQLGLLGLIAQKGGFPDVTGVPGIFEYWSLAAKGSTLGYRDSPVGLNKKGEGIAPEEFAHRAEEVLGEAVRRWLTGGEPFVAKLHPEYAPYGDYDQLMRLDEWYGRVARRSEA